MELNTLLDKDNILKPIDPILNSKDIYIGFTMTRVQDTHPLCKLFTNDFRKTNGITEAIIPDLVERMQKDIHYIHSKKCLIVDCNEFNFLVDGKTYKIPYFIDVNSYQTPSFPPTAIMPNIRDYHSSTFNELTDWYSFGIIACQLFVGIHPFKGRHPKFKQNDFIERMKQNISIFNKDVSVPSATRDFGLIPIEYRKWFERVFEKGERVPPPAIAGTMTIAPTVVIVRSSDNLTFDLLREFKSDIVGFYSHNSEYAVITKDKTINIGRKEIQTDDPNAMVMFLEDSSAVIVESKNTLNFRSFEYKFNEFGSVVNQFNNLAISKKFISNNRLFITYDNKFLEVQITDVGETKIASTAYGVVREFLKNSSQVLDGLIYQDTLVVPYLMIPFHNSKNIPCCMIKAFDELKGYKVINGKHDSGVCMIIGFKDNKYDKFIFKFDDSYDKYDLRIINDVSHLDLNFVTLENGIVAHIQEDGELEIFSKNLAYKKIRLVGNHQIKTSMTLYKLGIKVVFSMGNKLFSMSIN
jgi:hypothetical protein